MIIIERRSKFGPACDCLGETITELTRDGVWWAAYLAVLPSSMANGADAKIADEWAASHADEAAKRFDAMERARKEPLPVPADASSVSSLPVAPSVVTCGLCGQPCSSAEARLTVAGYVCGPCARDHEPRGGL